MIKIIYNIKVRGLINLAQMSQIYEPDYLIKTALLTFSMLLAPFSLNLNPSCTRGG